MRRLRWGQVWRAWTALQKARPTWDDPLDGNSILVLCAHVDDDAIGCGGTLARHSQQGAQITAVYLASGGEARKAEARELAKILSYRESVLLDFPIETLGAHPEASDRIAEILQAGLWDRVYLPFCVDSHKDHLAVSQWFLGAATKVGLTSSLVLGYETWTPLVPTRVVDISAVVEIKRRAIEACRSQMAELDYVTMALSLNRYRGLTATRGRHVEYAEAFYAASVEEYRQLWKALYG